MQTQPGRVVAAPPGAQNVLFRPPAQPLPPPRNNTADGYERWYTDPTVNNRMVLSLQSSIDQEVHWALERLLRLSIGEIFYFEKTPGLVDALFDWPEWYVREGFKQLNDEYALFSPSPALSKQRRHALNSVAVLRNAAYFDSNVQMLIYHPRPIPLVCAALASLDPTVDDHAEFLLNVLEFWHSFCAYHSVGQLANNLYWDPVPRIGQLLSVSTNRSLIIAALVSVNVFFGNPQNLPLLSPSSPILEAALRYLPLANDKKLVEACIEYLHTHLSHPPMAKEFLLHRQMPATVKLLVHVILSEQLEETHEVQIQEEAPRIATQAAFARDYELTKEDKERLLGLPEPERCSTWMRLMFVAKKYSELTQVEFWNHYKAAFGPHEREHPMLVAAEVIKNISSVFKEAQPSMENGKFLVRGVDRRKVSSTEATFTCLWDRGACQTAFPSVGDLFDHILTHLDAASNPCLWGSCTHDALPMTALRRHLLTHLPSPHAPQTPASQNDHISIASEDESYPMKDPTTRPPAPVRTVLRMSEPTGNPPSNSLAALLCLRILFGGAFGALESAPRAGEDRFGFPGVTYAEEEENVVSTMSRDREREGEVRARKAFLGVRNLMEGVQIKDEVLMGWIHEMVDIL
uniref:RFX-type winged-helix domain-containing protein n=1 Tax=Mycena chlorophos TaxID=658473 RepID=A0ABQ0LXH7_MYCCL|nr:predicted protein [Mycena chlorophos]